MTKLTQRELIAYIIYTSGQINNYSEKTIDNYIEKLENNINDKNIGNIFMNVKLSLFNDFEFSADLFYSEITAYAKLIYNRLLNYADRNFNNKDIIVESKFVYNRFSVRTAKEEVIRLGL